jgi:hypothetical protein
MPTKKLSLLLVALITCASQPALTQGGGAGGAGGGASSGAASSGTAGSSGNAGDSGNAGSRAGAPGAMSNDGNARGRAGAPGATSNGWERFDRPVPPAGSTDNRGTEAENAPSAAARGGSSGRVGVGTTPTGRPIGSVGSGPGSPEQPR